MDKTVVVDLSMALSRVDGDQDLFLTLAGLFLQESPKEVAAIHAALGLQDRARLVDASHKLKGSAIEMCVPGLIDSATRLEELARLGKFAEASPVYAEVEILLAGVHAALRDFTSRGSSS